MKAKLECIVCGRKFPEGQGIKLTMKGEDYYFHSKACAYMFLKEAVYNVDVDEISGIFKELRKKYEEINEKKRQAAKKVI
jgi:YHS domain-containing protein